MCIEAAKIDRSNKEELKIGYLRCYTEVEFHRALELFSEKHPDVEMSVAYGNHEELYNLLRTGNADIVLNDQRRVFGRICQSDSDNLPKLYRSLVAQLACANGAHFPI